jgi:hypothetical protein
MSLALLRVACAAKRGDIGESLLYSGESLLYSGESLLYSGESLLCSG